MSNLGNMENSNKICDITFKDVSYKIRIQDPNDKKNSKFSTYKNIEKNKKLKKLYLIMFLDMQEVVSA